MNKFRYYYSSVYDTGTFSNVQILIFRKFTSNYGSAYKTFLTIQNFVIVMQINFSYQSEVMNN